MGIDVIRLRIPVSPYHKKANPSWIRLGPTQGVGSHSPKSSALSLFRIGFCFELFLKPKPAWVEDFVFDQSPKKEETNSSGHQGYPIVATELGFEEESEAEGDAEVEYHQYLGKSSIESHS